MNDLCGFIERSNNWGWGIDFPLGFGNGSASNRVEGADVAEVYAARWTVWE